MPWSQHPFDERPQACDVVDMPRKLSPTQIEALGADYDAWIKRDKGDPTTAEDIARLHGVSKGTLYNYLGTRKRKRRTAPRPRTGWKLTAAQVEALVADYEAWDPFSRTDKRTIDDIVKQHGVSKQQLYDYVVKPSRAVGHAPLEVVQLGKKLAEAIAANTFLATELAAARKIVK